MNRYLTQSGIPNRSDVACAMDFVRRIALAAQAYSVANIPSPANKTSNPGPGANRKIVPKIVIAPPMTPMKMRQIREP